MGRSCGVLGQQPIHIEHAQFCAFPKRACSNQRHERNNTRKERAGHEIRRRTARRIGTRRDGSTGEEKALASFHLTATFCETRLLGIDYSTRTSKEKVDCEQSSLGVVRGGGGGTVLANFKRGGFI